MTLDAESQVLYDREMFRQRIRDGHFDNAIYVNDPIAHMLIAWGFKPIACVMFWFRTRYSITNDDPIKRWIFDAPDDETLSAISVADKSGYGCAWGWEVLDDFKMGSIDLAAVLRLDYQIKRLTQEG